MESMRLYEISDQLRAVLDGFMVVDEETGEVLADADDLDRLNLSMTLKVEGCVLYSKGLKARAEYARSEARRINELAKALEDKAASIDRYAAEQVDKVGGKVESPHARVSVRHTTAVEIIDEDAIPNSYIRVKTTETPDKKAIKSAILDGMDVPGATVVTNKSLVIK